jgi:hypothetical protein
MSYVEIYSDHYEIPPLLPLQKALVTAFMQEQADGW